MKADPVRDRNKVGVRMAVNRVRNQDIKDVNRSWDWIKKQRGIPEAAPPAASIRGPATPPAVPPPLTKPKPKKPEASGEGEDAGKSA